MDRPTIVCLCGSTRFYKEFVEANYRETMDGKIVLSVGFYPHAASEMHGEGVGITPEEKEQLDRLHLRKIDMADEVLILNCEGYVGESTRNELAYAHRLGKRIRWLESNEALRELEKDRQAELAWAQEQAKELRIAIHRNYDQRLERMFAATNACTDEAH